MLVDITALGLMESAINYSLSDVDTAFLPEPTKQSISFTLTADANNEINFTSVANTTKTLANSVRNYITSNVRLEYCNNLAKFDSHNKFMSGVDLQGNCDPKSNSVYKSVLFGADPTLVACQVFFAPAQPGFKSCINDDAINYYISKTKDIFEFLVNSQNVLFGKLIIGYTEPVYTDELIMHEYSFYKVKIKIRPISSSIL